MDPIELLELCVVGAARGTPSDVVVPRIFTPGEFESTWRSSPMTVRAHFDAILCSAHPGDGLELLLKAGCLEALLPEIREMKGLGEDPAAALHKDVWEHTKQVVSNVPNQLELRWGALMHDIGKARTRRVEKGKVTFHNHDMVGAKMVDQIERRLGLFSHGKSSLHGTVRSLVLNHLRPAGYKSNWTDSGVRRLLTDLGGMQGFEKLMQLSRADLTTKNPRKRDRALARGRELEERVKAVYAQDNAPKLPKGTMGLIIERGLCQVGPALNPIRAWLEQMMLDGRLPADRDAEFYATVGFETYKREHAKLTDEIQAQMQAVLSRDA